MPPRTIFQLLAPGTSSRLGTRSSDQDAQALFSATSWKRWCLLNDPVAEEVYERLFAAVRENKGKDKVVFVDQSSLKPRTSSECRGVDSGKQD
jgi:hypothetical protein